MHLARVCRSQWPRVKRRVVVTGLGVVSCLGVGTKHVWRRLVAGETGIAALTEPEFAWLPSRVGGLVPVGEEDGQLRPSQLDSSLIRQRSLASMYGLIAAEEALTDAGWKPKDAAAQMYTGVSLGRVTADAEALGLGYHVTQPGRNLRKLNPYTAPRAMCNIAAFTVGEKFGFTGPQLTAASACAAGTHALIFAYQSILLGDAKVVVAGGTDAIVTPYFLTVYARTRGLSINFNHQPQRASRPFDADRDGFVAADGAAILVLEEVSHALDRGARIYAEVLGYGLCRDWGTVTSPSSDGRGVTRCMGQALCNAGLTADDVTYVNAHATSTPAGDEAEAVGIKNLFGDRSKHVHVASNKGALGHMQGAAGAVEALSTVLSCHDGVIPPTVNLTNPDVDGLDYVINDAREWTNERRIAVTNSFGFGSDCGSLVFSNYIP